MLTACAILALLIMTTPPLPASALTLSEADIEAIGRTVFAEAGSQPAAGRVAVVDTILNRVASGSFGETVQAVIGQPGAFEPVTRARGWKNLPPLNTAQLTEIATILELKANGLLGDVSGGSLYFQNETIVAERARRGKVRDSLVGFNGMPRTAVIGDHTFYRPSGTPPPPAAIATKRKRSELKSMFMIADPVAFGGETDPSETVLVLSPPSPDETLKTE